MQAHQKILGTVMYLTSHIVLSNSVNLQCKDQPCHQAEWGVDIQALYLRADFVNLNYIGSETTATLTTSEEHFIDKKFNYGLGFKLETFLISKNAKDLNLNWYHYKHVTQRTLPDGINIYDTFFGGIVNTSLNPEWDAVNLELGQRINISSWGNIRVHGGLQYTNIQLENITTGTSSFIGEGKSRTNNSSFQGIGLRIGADLNYELTSGFALYSNVATALLTGQQSFNRQAIIYIDTGGTYTYLSENLGKTSATVTELEGKLGVSYLHQLTKGMLQLNAGWMWVNYYDVIQIADSFHNGRTKESNFSVGGPFAGLRWTGDYI